MKTPITIDSLLKRSWKMVVAEWRESLVFLLPTILIPFLCSLPFAFAMEAGRYRIPAIILYVLGILAALYFATSLLKYFVNVVFGMKRSPWLTSREFLGTLTIRILYFLIVIIGFLLFIIPGIWLAVLFAFSVPMYLREKTTPLAAMRKSAELVRGRWWAGFVRLLVPNLVWQIGIFIAVIVAFIAFFALGSIWYFITAAAASAVSAGAMRVINFLGGIMSILAIVGVFVFEIVAFLVAALAKLSILLETYRSLEETK